MKHLMKKSEIKGTLEVFNIRLNTEEEENQWTWLCEVNLSEVVLFETFQNEAQRE